MFFSRNIESIQSWLGRRRLRRYGLRFATEDDLDFIMAEIIEGARNGHYASSLLDQEQERGFRDQLKNVIQFSAMVRLSDRGIEQIAARLLVYGSPKDDKVGYLLASEKLPGSIESEIELYKIGVSKDHRDQGHGRRIVQLFIAFAPRTAVLYARCFRSSEVMFALLQEEGFSHVRTTPGGTRELELCQAHIN